MLWCEVITVYIAHEITQKNYKIIDRAVTKMHAPLHVCKVIRYVAASAWRRFEFSIVSCSLSPWYYFAQNATSSSVVGSDYLPQILSKSVQHLCEAKEMPTSARDIGTTGRTLGQRDITASAAHSLRSSSYECAVRRCCGWYLSSGVLERNVFAISRTLADRHWTFGTSLVGCLSWHLTFDHLCRPHWRIWQQQQQQAVWPPGSADTVCPRPSVTLTFDFLTSKLVCESHQKWGTFLPNLGTLGLWVFELFAMYVTDGQTDKQRDTWTHK